MNFLRNRLRLRIITWNENIKMKAIEQYFPLAVLNYVVQNACKFGVWMKSFSVGGSNSVLSMKMVNPKVWRFKIM